MMRAESIFSCFDNVADVKEIIIEAAKKWKS